MRFDPREIPGQAVAEALSLCAAKREKGGWSYTPADVGKDAAKMLKAMYEGLDK